MHCVKLSVSYLILSDLILSDLILSLYIKKNMRHVTLEKRLIDWLTD